jgi:hypothetical protein
MTEDSVIAAKVLGDVLQAAMHFIFFVRVEDH